MGLDAKQIFSKYLLAEWKVWLRVAFILMQFTWVLPKAFHFMAYVGMIKKHALYGIKRIHFGRTKSWLPDRLQSGESNKWNYFQQIPTRISSWYNIIQYFHHVSKQWCKISPKMVGGWSTHGLRNGWESWTCSAWRRQGFREGKNSLGRAYKESRDRLFTEVCGKRQTLWSYTESVEVSIIYEEKEIAMRTIRHWTRMARNVMKSLSLEDLKIWLDEAWNNLTWIQIGLVLSRNLDWMASQNLPLGGM